MALFVHPPEISAVKSIFNPNPYPHVIKSLSVFRSDERIRSRARTGARIAFRGCEARVSQSNQNLLLYGQFSAPVKQESKQEEEKQDYYVNMGYAIRTLREEFPELFYRELSFDIYRFNWLISLICLLLCIYLYFIACDIFTIIYMLWIKGEDYTICS